MKDGEQKILNELQHLNEDVVLAFHNLRGD